MQIRFWGTRGSIAKPGPSTVRYGGNTSCVELRSESGTLVVIDCGTGAHGLGHALVQEDANAMGGHILISHTHWDHIQGLPFFAPRFVPGSHWDIYGPAGLSEGLRQTLARQMEYTYFPVALDQFAAQIRYHDLVEGKFSIGDINITAQYLNHPALTLGYRFQADGVTVVYSCDHEPHSPAAASGDTTLSGRDAQHAEFLSGADLVIHDSQYLAVEYSGKTGWGHSTAEYVIKACQQAGVGKVLLTHHDPLRDDDSIDALLATLRQRIGDSGVPLEVQAAAEGQHVRLFNAAAAAAPPKSFSAETPMRPEAMSRQIVMRIADPDLARQLSEAVELEDLPRPRLLESDDLPVLSTADCALVLLEHRPPDIDAIQLARQVRKAEPEHSIRLPLVVVSRNEPGEAAERIATDWLIAPFSLSYARTKIRAWMLRASCRWVRASDPPDEAQRLQALQALQLLDTPPEERFDRITRVAAATFGVSMSLVSLVDSNRQWFKSCVGLDITETSRDSAFCAHVVELRSDIVVPDTLLDNRFADNPLVAGDPGLRFYAGAPLILGNGRCVGTLCIMDRRPRTMTAKDLSALHDLRDMVVAELENGPVAEMA